MLTSDEMDVVGALHGIAQGRLRELSALWSDLATIALNRREEIDEDLLTQREREVATLLHIAATCQGIAATQAAWSLSPASGGTSAGRRHP